MAQNYFFLLTFNFLIYGIITNCYPGDCAAYLLRLTVTVSEKTNCGNELDWTRIQHTV